MKLFEDCRACEGRGSFGDHASEPDGSYSYRFCQMCDGCGLDVGKPVDRELMRHLRLFLKLEQENAR